MLYIFRPFFYPIFWAAVIAMLFHPFYVRINSQIKIAGVSSLISIILVIVLILLPLILVAVLLVQKSISFYTNISGADTVVNNVQGFATWLQSTPLAPYVSEIQSQWTEYAANTARAIGLFVFDNIKYVTQNSFTFIFMLFIMFYTMYYFFKDGEKILKRLSHLSPLGDKYEIMLYKKFRTASVASLKGTLIIGGIQGALGGLLFWFTGVPGAFVWGVVMVVMSIIPAVGSFLVWMPAGIIMLVTGHTWQGIVILLFGTFVISLIDNVLRPPLIGKEIEIHPLIILFSTLGGIILFGISGFIIGPIISALFLAVISIYDHYYKTELSHN